MPNCYSNPNSNTDEFPSSLVDGRIDRGASSAQLLVDSSNIIQWRRQPDSGLTLF